MLANLQKRYPRKNLSTQLFASASTKPFTARGLFERLLTFESGLSKKLEHIPYILKLVQIFSFYMDAYNEFYK